MVQAWSEPEGLRTRRDDSKGRRKLISQFNSQSGQRENSHFFFLFYLGLQWIREGPPTLGKAISFTTFTNSNASFSKKHLHRCTQKRMFS